MRKQVQFTCMAMLGIALGAVSGCDDDGTVGTPDASSLIDGGLDGGARDGNRDMSSGDGAGPDGGGSPTDGGAGRDGSATDGGGQDGGGSVPTILALTGTGNTSILMTFPANAPQTASTPVVVTGLAPAEVLISITVRPSNGKVYGLGSTSRLYEVNTTTGVATALGTAPFTPALTGQYYGFDFNPVPDRIRLVSDAEQNLRLHPDTGAVAATDATLNPAGSIGPAAYTNSAPGATVTTLFALDYASNQLVRLGGPDGMPAPAMSPNMGVINPIGPVGVDIGEPASFDITPDNTAYAAWQTAGVSTFYIVNLMTGAASAVGPIGGVMGANMVRSIAVVP